MNAKCFNGEAFSLRLRLTMARKTLSTREVELLTSVSKSIISRVCRGYKPDIDSYFTLTAWMDRQEKETP